MLLSGEEVLVDYGKDYDFPNNYVTIYDNQANGWRKGTACCLLAVTVPSYADPRNRSCPAASTVGAARTVQENELDFKNLNSVLVFRGAIEAGVDAMQVLLSKEEDMNISVEIANGVSHPEVTKELLPWLEEQLPAIMKQVHPSKGKDRCSTFNSMTCLSQQRYHRRKRSIEGGGRE